MKRVLRPVIRAVGAPFAVAALALLRLTGRRLGFVLLYHSTGERNRRPEREIVPPHPPRLFAGQIRHVARWYRVVDADRLLDAVAARRRGDRFPVAITFDDDLREHVSVAMPILQRHRVPGTFFLCGASLDGPFAFWWERLQRAFDEAPGRVHEIVAAKAPEVGSTDDVRVLAEAIEAMSEADRDDVATSLESVTGPDHDESGLRAHDVRALVDGGMTIGFHTLRHHPMDALAADSLERALHDGRERLEALAAARMDTIAYPHGRTNASVAAAALASGFRVGFSAQGLPVRPDEDPLLVPRITPSYRSVGHFAVELVLRLLASGEGVRG